MMKKRGGRRSNAGRKAKPQSKSVSQSCRISREVADYIAVVGSGVIEASIRRSKHFKLWAKGAGL